MADDHKPQQGDEAELFAAYNERLMRRVGAATRAPDEVVEDACSFAWAQFLRYQPDRHRGWRAWLLTTAVRATWALEQERREMRSLSAERFEPNSVPEPADPHDQFLEREGLEAAVEVLEQLPPRLRRVAFLRATGHRYAEIAEITGDSRTRVSQLIRRANEHIREALEELDEPEASVPPRAQRLRELEDFPPRWLVREIGRPPRGSRLRRHAYATRVLDWRRAALAIENYRALTGFKSEERALGMRPRDEDLAEAFDAAVVAVETLGRHRECSQQLSD